MTWPCISAFAVASRRRSGEQAVLRVLLAAIKETRQNGGDLRLAAVQANVNKVLTLAGISSAIEQYPDVEGAISSFRGAA